MDEYSGGGNYQSYSKAKYRYFFLSFSLSFLILSLLYLFLINAVQPRVPKSLSAENKPDAAQATYIPTEKDSMSVLFIGVGEDDTNAGSFILARFDPVRGTVPIVSFPRQTAVKNGDGMEPLTEVFRYGGADYTRNALAETIGEPIDRYVKIRSDSFVLAAAAVGSVEYDLEQPVTISRGGAEVTLNQGKQLLDGQKVLDIIRYSDYTGGELERCKITTGLTAEIVNQRMDIFRSTVIDSVFEKLINLIVTDISYTDYYNRKRAAEFLAKVGNKPAMPVEVSGSFSEDGKLYNLSDTFIALLSQILR